MNHRCSLLLGLGATLVSSAAVAQNAGIAVNTPLAYSMTSSDICRMACVDLDQNLTMDAVFLVGTRPYAAFEPDYWQQYVPLMDNTYSFLDVCAAPGLGVNGADAVAMVGASGLWLVSRQAPSATSQGALVAVRVDAATNLFVGCKRIVCGDLDNNGDNELIGVTGDGFTLRRAFRVGGVWSTITVNGSYSTSIDDVEIVDWDGGARKEVAVLRQNPGSTTTGRCEVRFFNSTLTGLSGSYYWYMPGIGVAMSKIRHRGRLYDQLALVYRYGSPQMNWFTVFGAEAPLLPGETKTHEAGFTLGPVSTVDVSSGHIATYEGEEDTTSPFDVVITHNFSPDQLLLPNLSTTDPASASFSSAPEFIWLLPLANFTSPYSNFTSTAGVADFDGDGDGDVLIPSRPSGQVSLFRNGLSADESDYKIYFAGEGTLEEVTDSSGTYHNLTINIAQAPKLVNKADRLIVMVYRQPVVSGTTQPIEETPITHAITNVWYDVASLGLGATLSLTFPIYEASVTSDNRYHIVLRPMAYDGDLSKYTHAFPTTKYVFSMKNEVFAELATNNASYFETAGGGGGGDAGVAEPMLDVAAPEVEPDFADLTALWMPEPDVVTGGGNGGQSSGGSSGTNPTKKGGTQTGGVVVVVVPDPFGTATPPPRPNASTP